MKIATHSGSFQADEVFAVAILSMVYDDIELIRSRDPEKYSTADIRVDVGLKYDPETGDYDHHQPEGAGVREGSEIPYAAAGLVWKHFGRQLVQTDEEHKRIDDKLMQFLDADDCGIKTYIPDKCDPYTIPKLVKAFNPSWQDEKPDYDGQFRKCVDIAIELIKEEIHAGRGFKLAEELTKKAIEESENPDIVVLEQYCPWKKTVMEESDAKFVVYPSFNGEWKVQGVPVEKGAFDVKVQFPDQWAGLESDKLSEVTGVPGCIFCHRGLWIAGTTSKQAAIRLAEMALEGQEQ